MTKLIFPKGFKEKLKQEIIDELKNRKVRLDSSDFDFIMSKTQDLIDAIPKFDDEIIKELSNKIGLLQNEKKIVSNNPITKEVRTDFINEILDQIKIPNSGKEGKQGKKGTDGKDGHNYSLTDQDKLDIADSVEKKDFIDTKEFNQKIAQLIKDLQNGRIRLPAHSGANGPEVIAKIDKALGQDDWKQGGSTNKLKSVATNYTITQDDFIVFADATANTVDISLPLDPVHGNVFVVKCLDSTFACNVLSNGKNIDGLAVDRNLLEDQAETYQFDEVFGWGIRYNPAVQDGMIYLKGNEKIDGSLRIIVGIDPKKVRIEERTSGVWNTTSIEVAQASVSIGRNLELSASGEWLETRNQQDQLDSLIPHLDYDENGSFPPHCPNLGRKLIKQFIGGGLNAEVIGTSLTTSFTSADNALARRFYVFTGSVGAISPVRITFTSESINGNVIWEKTLPTETFATPFDPDVFWDIGGAIQNIPNETIFLTATSDNNISFVSDSNGDWILGADFWRYTKDDFIMDDRVFTSDPVPIMVRDLDFVITKGELLQ